jgi:hypothetical protein
MPTVRYHGTRGELVGTCRVYAEDEHGQRRRLHHRTGHRSHSPTGFEWGYGGSGPAELARALVKDAMRDLGDPDDPDPRIYQRFKFMFVVSFAHDGWSLEADVVRAFVQFAEAAEIVEHP